MVVGSVLTTIGAGLVYTLNIGSPSSEWIGYQVLAGIGSGVSFQIPIIVAQGVSSPSDLSSVSSIILFFQTVTGALFISIAQSLFTNKLLQEVAANVPGVSPELVVITGATELKDVFKDHLLGVRRSYMAGLKDAYILAIALGSVACIIAVITLVFDNRNLKAKDQVKADDEAAR